MEDARQQPASAPGARNGRRKAAGTWTRTGLGVWLGASLLASGCGGAGTPARGEIPPARTIRAPGPTRVLAHRAAAGTPEAEKPGVGEVGAPRIWGARAGVVSPGVAGVVSPGVAGAASPGAAGAVSPGVAALGAGGATGGAEADGTGVLDRAELEGGLAAAPAYGPGGRITKVLLDPASGEVVLRLRARGGGLALGGLRVDLVGGDGAARALASLGAAALKAPSRIPAGGAVRLRVPLEAPVLAALGAAKGPAGLALVPIDPAGKALQGAPSGGIRVPLSLY